MAASRLYAPVVGMAATSDRRGYWLAGGDGAVFTFGDGRFYGSSATAVLTPSIASIVSTTDGGGYWLLDPATIPTTFSHPGAAPGTSRGQDIVRAAATALGGNPSPGWFCNPYGPCEEWCALFATWAWEAARVPIPRYGFTGDIYHWAAGHGAVLAPSARPAPGDAALYGTGPENGNSSLHVGIVTQVWPHGAIVTLDGDAGPGPPGSANVIINGPFLPADSRAYNGFAVYAYAVP